MELVVVDKVVVARDVVRLRLAPRTPQPQLAIEPGARMEILFAGFTRSYSLISDPTRLPHYEICVLRNSAGRGGSVYIHDTLAAGDAITLLGIRNAFPLARNALRTLFIAGGIGITPFLSMARSLHEMAIDFELHYAARSKDRLLPLPAWLQARTQTYVDSTGSPSMDVAAVMARIDRSSHVYVCGPNGLISAVRAESAALGFADANIHFEAFGASWLPTDQPLCVRLTQSNMAIHVPAGTTILDALIEKGIWAPHYCRAGRCATCLTQVVAGEPLHRDSLTIAQRAGAICTCVSWASGPELVLEL